jgi:hypothetical protein
VAHSAAFRTTFVLSDFVLLSPFRDHGVTTRRRGRVVPHHPTGRLYKRILQREEYIKMGYDPDQPLNAQKKST